jgi:DNA-binding Lrp family transcriptional regulator
MMFDHIDKKIIAAMQDDLPLTAQPYKLIAERLGITEDELLERLNHYRRSGKIRKMGVVLKHREVGYAANALCAFVAPPERLDEIGRIFVGHAAITHCYTRVPRREWPYNFYVMLHAHTREECRSVAAELAKQAAVDRYIMLFSTREWKKTSMRYFDGEQGNS